MADYTYSQLKSFIETYITDTPLLKIRGNTVNRAVEGTMELVISTSHYRFPRGKVGPADIGKMVCNQEGSAALPVIEKSAGGLGHPVWPYLGLVLDVDGTDVVISGAERFMATVGVNSDAMTFDADNRFLSRAMLLDSDGYLVSLAGRMAEASGTDMEVIHELVLNPIFMAVLSTTCGPGDTVVVDSIDISLAQMLVS